MMLSICAWLGKAGFLGADEPGPLGIIGPAVKYPALVVMVVMLHTRIEK
jgi:hypothetical protein